MKVSVKPGPMKSKTSSLDSDLREIFGAGVFQALSKPHRKTNLHAGIQLDENHAGTISGGNRNGTTLENVGAQCTRTFQTRLANRLHGSISI
mgnify:CR=1 FL=1